MCIECVKPCATDRRLFCCEKISKLPAHAKTKEVIHCYDVETIPYSEVLLKLRCQDINFTSIHAFPNLTELDLSGNIDKKKYKTKNKLLELGFTPFDIPSMPNLIKLGIYRLFVTKINHFPQLKYLNCGFSFIEELPDEMLNLEELGCATLKISKLPVMPKLRKLHIEYTNIDKIDYYPMLESLSCCKTQIKELPYDMPHLSNLDCDDTNISKLPYIPKIQHLSIQNTPITELPTYAMPDLETLHLNNTKVLRLPNPDICSLEVLYIEKTYISMLPYYESLWEIGADKELFVDPQYHNEWTDEGQLKLVHTLTIGQRNVKRQILRRLIRRVGIVLYKASGIYDLKAACRFADYIVELL